MDSETLLARITDYENRPNPYPLYAELREAGPVVRQADGSYLVGNYHEVAAQLGPGRCHARRDRPDHQGTDGALRGGPAARRRRRFRLPAARHGDLPPA